MPDEEADNDDDILLKIDVAQILIQERIERGDFPTYDLGELSELRVIADGLQNIPAPIPHIGIWYLAGALFLNPNNHLMDDCHHQLLVVEFGLLEVVRYNAVYELGDFVVGVRVDEGG